MIDHASDPGAWTDAFRFPPFIADGRDGVLVNRAFQLRDRDARRHCAAAAGADDGSDAFHDGENSNA